MGGVSAVTDAITPEDLAVWRGLQRVQLTIMRRLENALLAAHDLPLASFDVLQQLAEAPQHRLRMNDLAVGVLLSRSGLTRLVDRLERDGLVARNACANDARGLFAVLTPAGGKRLADATPTYHRCIREHFLDRIGAVELRQIAATASKLAGLSLRAAVQHAPLGERGGEAGRQRERCELRRPNPAGIGCVVTGGELTAGDGRGVVIDVEDRSVRPGPRHRADQLSRCDRQSRLLTDLAGHRLLVRLARFNPPTGQRPQPGAGRMAASDQQEPASGVLDHRADARNSSTRHAASIAGPGKTPPSPPPDRHHCQRPARQ